MLTFVSRRDGLTLYSETGPDTEWWWGVYTDPQRTKPLSSNIDHYLKDRKDHRLWLLLNCGVWTQTQTATCEDMVAAFASFGYESSSFELETKNFGSFQVLDKNGDNLDTVIVNSLEEQVTLRCDLFTMSISFRRLLEIVRLICECGASQKEILGLLRWRSS